jgi:hypothetical protein
VSTSDAVAHLDRCSHWRHEGDVCAGWSGPSEQDGGCRGGISLGNPHAHEVIGWTLYGAPITPAILFALARGGELP